MNLPALKFNFINIIIKRIFDLFASISGLLILFPFLLFFALAIKVSTPGNIFFRQLRVGKDGSLFRLLKFRTMQNIPHASEGRFDPGDKSRVTRIGSFLRKYKLDELPQLINVIKGEMSIVGPRPEIKQWTQVYPEKWEIVLRVTPGITDNASIVFSDEEELLSKSDNPNETYRDVILPRKLDLYVSYVKNHSFSGDISIVFRTLIKVISK
jgi:lipopolysaccharide/colanic/teichoic acid biosynthesis glycosyltransferase